MKDRIDFVHSSDTHIGPDFDYLVHGVNTFNRSRELVNMIDGLDAPIDFVVHTGDVVNRPDDDSVRIVKCLFSELKTPIYYTIGNHDLTPMPWFHPAPGSVRAIGGVSDNSYVFRREHCVFVQLDTKGPSAIDSHGIFTDENEMVLKKALSDNKENPIVIFIHFPPLSLDAPWITRDMLLLLTC
jgi:3',5'-cyclic AMP phosphodiesterase CpdA